MATPLLSMLFVFVVATIPVGILADVGRKELRTKEQNQERVIQLGSSRRSNVVDPSRVIQLSWQPRVFLYRGFLTEEESNSLISGDEEVAARVEERISAWSFLPKKNGKSLRLMHFEVEDAKGKYDYFGNATALQLNVPVMATVILYLSNVTQGGQIIFPRSKNQLLSDCTKSSEILRPSKGNAILFFNLHLDATPDDTSSHTRCPVLEGEMWCATKIFHVRADNREENSPQLDTDTDCTDEDENCPGWAATGECEKNPVFMIGTTDYYGTCRKSCKAC